MEDKRIDPKDDMPQWRIVFPSIQFEARDRGEAEWIMQEMRDCCELEPTLEEVEDGKIRNR